MVGDEVFGLRGEFARRPAINHCTALAVRSERLRLPIVWERVRDRNRFILFLLFLLSLVPLFFFAPLLPRCCPGLRFFVAPLAVCHVLIFGVITDS